MGARYTHPAPRTTAARLVPWLTMPARHPSPRLSWAWALLAVLALARTARAQEVEVVVKSEGQPWSIGDRAGEDCTPSCTLHVAPRKYHVTMGDTSEDVLIDVPSEVVYRPALHPLRYTGFALIGVGLVAGGLLTYGAVKGCGSTNPMTMSFCTSRATQNIFAGIAAVSFGTAVAGGFMAYFGGESIRVRDLPQRRSSGFTLDVSGQGASVGWSLAF
jgi:hypothetical protein